MIPIIDFVSLKTANGKEELRKALFSIGFLYLVNTGLEVGSINQNQNNARESKHHGVGAH